MVSIPLFATHALALIDVKCYSVCGGPVANRVYNQIVEHCGHHCY